MENNSGLSGFDFDELWEDPPPGFHPKTGDGSSPSVSSDLVLDGERGVVVEAAAAGLSVERKGMSAERSTAALRSHSEAERKRRARINSHLDTLRKVVPATEKMDKASLLGEVIAFPTMPTGQFPIPVGASNDEVDPPLPELGDIEPSLQDKGWISPPDSMYSSNGESGTTSAEASLPGSFSDPTEVTGQLLQESYTGDENDPNYIPFPEMDLPWSCEL